MLYIYKNWPICKIIKFYLKKKETHKMFGTDQTSKTILRTLN